MGAFPDNSKGSNIMKNRNGGNWLTFTGRGGAAVAGPLPIKQQSINTDGQRKRNTLRAMLINANKEEYRLRAREFGRMNLLEGGRSLLGKSFGRTLRACRKARGYSQEELAAIVGLDRTYPSLLERGLRVPTIGVVVALGCALTSPVELYCAFLDALRESAGARGKSLAAVRRPALTLEHPAS